MSELKEVADNLETMGPLAACTAPPRVARSTGGPEEDGEIRVVAEIQVDTTDQEAAAVPCTPVGSAPQAAGAMEAGDTSTPPKTGAPPKEEEVAVDLLGLDLEPTKIEKIPPPPGRAPGEAALIDLL